MDKPTGMLSAIVSETASPPDFEASFRLVEDLQAEIADIINTAIIESEVLNLIVKNLKFD
jgi:hypothetical protein